jgi:hypothetical protein
VRAGSCHGVNPTHLTEVEQDVANFLLIRGKYAYLGNGWTGCSHFYEYPAEQFNADYGEMMCLACETIAIRNHCLVVCGRGTNWSGQGDCIRRIHERVHESNCADGLQLVHAENHVQVVRAFIDSPRI